MKDNLDFSTRIAHHDDPEAYLDVSITNYQDGARMSITTSGKQRVTINKAELIQLSNILNRYEEAEKILNGEKP